MTNTPFVSAKICAPNGQCAIVDHLILDTGSAGVRVIDTALPAALRASLPAQTGATDDTTGNAPIAQCAGFMSGFTWGPIKRASVTIGGKTADSLPIQVVGESEFPATAACARTGSNLSTAGMLGANGIVGISNALTDYPAAATTRYSALYYFCNSSTNCSSTLLSTDRQVANPLTRFNGDNNGTIIRLPALPIMGQASASGELIFGIGTRDNNALSADANVVKVSSAGTFTTVYKGKSLTSYIDSGTNTLSFPDSAIPTAGIGFWQEPFFAPLSVLNLSATVTPAAGGNTQADVWFRVANVNTLFSNPASSAFDDLATPTLTSQFMWGLPFFYGRSVYTALNNSTIGSLTGPFVAFQ